MNTARRRWTLWVLLLGSAAALHVLDGPGPHDGAVVQALAPSSASRPSPLPSPADAGEGAQRRDASAPVTRSKRYALPAGAPPPALFAPTGPAVAAAARAAPARTATARALPGWPLRFVGTQADAHGLAALFEDGPQWLAAARGATVQGWRIEAIEPQRVRLRRLADGRTLELSNE
jgi:hypothetical protein